MSISDKIEYYFDYSEEIVNKINNFIDWLNMESQPTWVRISGRTIAFLFTMTMIFAIFALCTGLLTLTAIVLTRIADFLVAHVIISMIIALIAILFWIYKVFTFAKENY